MGEIKPGDCWGGAAMRNFAGDQITVTITIAEYRDLVGKAALYDEQQRVYDEMASYGESE